VHHQFLFAQGGYLLLQPLVISHQVRKFLLGLAHEERVLIEEVAHSLEALGHELRLGCAVGRRLAVLYRAALRLPLRDVAAHEVILADQLQVELFQCRQVHFMHLCRQILPLWVLNQVEEVSLFAVEDKLTHFVVLFVD